MNRRTLLQAMLAGARQESGIVDSHVHFYDPSRPEGVPWPPKGDRLYRTVLPGPWEAMVRPLGVTGVVVVEASPWVEDNQWVLDLAKNNRVIVGFVGHLEPGTPEFQANLPRFGRNPIFRGLRLNARQLAAALRGDAAFSDLRRLSDAGMALDVIGDGSMLADVAALARRLPNLNIVIDHLPFPVPDGMLEALGKHERVYAKVSGVDPRQEYRQALDELWNVFGSKRLIYASNWPVSERVAPYARILGAVQEYFSARGAVAVRDFFRNNSARAYRWKPR